MSPHLTWLLCLVSWLDLTVNRTDGLPSWIWRGTNTEACFPFREALVVAGLSVATTAALLLVLKTLRNFDITVCWVSTREPRLYLRKLPKQWGNSTDCEYNCIYLCCIYIYIYYILEQLPLLSSTTRSHTFQWIQEYRKRLLLEKISIL